MGSTSFLGFSCSNHVLWDRNPGFLKSEIGPFSDFKRKSYLMDLKSAHSQESDFQESGEVDRFLKMGTHFQERSGSLENGLCVTWSGFWVCPGYLLWSSSTPSRFLTAVVSLEGDQARFG